MQPMERIAEFSLERIPETTFGVTFAAGTGKNTTMASPIDLAELEIVKAILNRETYLERLYDIVKTISKKVKPDFAVMLEMVRAATLEVIDAIVRWREAKGNHRAPYLWNGINYLLRTSSDLDYLGDYRALRRHMSFTLQRNPFSIAAPMEDGKSTLGRVIDSKISEENEMIIPGSHRVKEVAIGGIAFATLKQCYRVEFKEKLKVGNTVTIRPMTGIPLENASFAPKKQVTMMLDETLLPGGLSMSPTRSTSPTMLLPPATSQSINIPNTSREPTRPSPREYYIFRIRQAEIVLLKEEERHGKFARDPDGRMVPLITAKTRRLMSELSKDDKRPMLQKGTVAAYYAPFAEPSGVGLLAEEEIAEIDEKRRADQRNKSKVKDPDFVTNEEEENDMLRPTDTEAIPRNRGQDKVGGMLGPIEVKGG